MWKSAGRAPSKNANFTLAFALQLRKKHGKPVPFLQNTLNFIELLTAAHKPNLDYF
jgi:hypothetical protein